MGVIQGAALFASKSFVDLRSSEIHRALLVTIVTKLIYSELPVTHSSHDLDAACNPTLRAYPYSLHTQRAKAMGWCNCTYTSGISSSKNVFTVCNSSLDKMHIFVPQAWSVSPRSSFRRDSITAASQCVRVVVQRSAKVDRG